MMFGRRQSEERVVVLPTRATASGKGSVSTTNSIPTSANVGAPKSLHATAPSEVPYEIKSNAYYDIKQELFNALVEIVDVVQIAKMDAVNARTEIRDVVNEIIVSKKVPMSLTERQDLIEDLCNDVLGYG